MIILQNIFYKTFAVDSFLFIGGVVELSDFFTVKLLLHYSYIRYLTSFLFYFYYFFEKYDK